MRRLGNVILLMYYLQASNRNGLNSSQRLILIEVAIFEAILLIFLWFISEYTATLLSWIIPVLCTGILIISLIVEWVERSKVPRWYYWLLVVMGITPILVFIFFFILQEGQFEWMKHPF